MQKLCLESERKKEIEQVNKKYDKLILNAENANANKKTYIETCYNKVHEHKFLAEAMVQFQKLDKISAAGPQVKWGGTYVFSGTALTFSKKLGKI